MAEEIVDLKEKLLQCKFEANIFQKIDCSITEDKEFKDLLNSNQRLPDGIYEYVDADGTKMGKFYRRYETDLNQDELNLLLNLKQISYLKSIKNSMIFFVVLTVISLLCSIVLISNLTT